MQEKNTGLPFIGIISDPFNKKRRDRLMQELKSQGIAKYELFPSLYDERSVLASINKAHKQVVEYAMILGEPEVLVLEDDVRWCGEGAFQYFLSQKPSIYDIFLGGIYIGDINGGKVDEFSGFHCYMVHERFYEKFLSVPETQHIDRAMAGLGDFYVCDPFVAIQYNGFSSNSQKEEDYHHLLRHRKLYNNFEL